jgi:acetoin utilization deacetylase AcuC-like enzyme
MVFVYTPRCLEYSAPGHPERPDRLIGITARLKAHPQHRWLTPDPCRVEDILQVHTPGHLRAVQTGEYFDADTPHFPDIYEIARLAAGGAVVAAEEALAGHRAFSLMRPPGHHAERNRVMGFCYFNNIAIAVTKMLHERHLKRVAILDFDCHHGNGTEDIFYGDERVRFISIHQSPCYPGTGTATRKNCVNHPLPPGTPPAEFLEVLEQAVQAIQDFHPQLVGVSAGFDSYKDDPITDMALEVETYRHVGVALSRLKPPCFAVLEGGYADELAACVEAFVAGWEQPV